MKFEAHMTYERGLADDVRKISSDTEWSFSQFDADPVMGDKPFCYLTAYSTDPHKLLSEMKLVEKHGEDQYGILPLRLKIERIIYDTKTHFSEIEEFK